MADSRLTWQGAAHLPPEVREELMGRGGPYEIVVESVLGVPIEVFKMRPPNLCAALIDAAQRWGDQPFLISGDRSTSFRETLHQAQAVARALREEHEVEEGDRVAIVAATIPEYVTAVWGILWAGAVVTGLNGWWAGTEMRHGIHISSPKLVLSDEKRLPVLREIGGEVGAAVLEISTFVAEVGSDLTDPTPPAPADEDDPAMILFTSGTTGRPKAAALSHRGFLHFGRTTQLSQAIGSHFSGGPAEPPVRGAMIASSPMFHVSGLVGVLMSGPLSGTTLVFPPPGRWDETTHLQLTEQHRITSWSGVPTQYWRLIQHPRLDEFDLSSLTTVGGGGAVFPPELIRLFTQRLPHVAFATGYGMTETTGMGTAIGSPLIELRPETIGVAGPTVEVEIRDPASGELLPEGEVGEINLRHAAVFLGYWDDPAATDSALDPHRWYRTGDFGRINDGFLVLESRMRDLIIRGGENIYPVEIENRLLEHPYIDEAAVVGVDHKVLGQEVKAFIVLAGGKQLSPQDVQAWVSDALASYKVPTHVEMRESLPYTDTGKLLKRELIHVEESDEGQSRLQVAD